MLVFCRGIMILQNEEVIMKYTGTVSRGIKAPIIKQGDNIEKIIFEAVKDVIENDGVILCDKDVIAITEAVVAKAQGNYVTLDQIASDVKTKFPAGTVGLVFPIFSRNRFSLILKAISLGAEKLIIQLPYPSDEVGNPLLDIDLLDEHNINPSVDVFTYQEFREIFPSTLHPFTDIDYLELYKEVGNCEIIMSNNPMTILQYTKNIIVGGIHNRKRLKRLLCKNGANIVYGLDEILNKSVDGSGFHPQYGLLGSNISKSDKLKLFPRDCDIFVNNIQKMFYDKYKVNIEVMIYGDGAFKDPIGGIWELADPVVSPGYTKGLEGTPDELKLKYLADNELQDLRGENAKEAMIDLIKNKKQNTIADNRLGTTPRRITDLLGSLADLTSGSGDKGTPIVLIQNYFTNYSD